MKYDPTWKQVIALAIVVLGILALVAMAVAGEVAIQNGGGYR